MYKRVLLKMSGEALSGDIGHGFNNEIIEKVAKEVKELVKMNIEVAIVVGGGNFFRGRTSEKVTRHRADYIGMLATCMNAIYLESFLKSEGVDAVVKSALSIENVVEGINIDQCISDLENKKVIIFSAGTGSPYFSTDTGAALRAVEIKADAILLAKNVDAVYDSDPKENKNAKKFKSLKFMDVLSKNLKVMDLSAITLCMDNNIPIKVFSLKESGNIVKAAKGEELGTYID